MLTPQETGEWAKKIAELYMNWYTFFVTANLLALGWFYSKDARRPPQMICFVFAMLNVCGAGSSLIVGYYISGEAGKFYALVVWSTVINALGLLGISAIWIVTLRENARSNKPHHK
jgi:hypothetical protein